MGTYRYLPIILLIRPSQPPVFYLLPGQQISIICSLQKIQNNTAVPSSNPQAAERARYIPANYPPFNRYTLDMNYQITYNSGCITSLYTDTYTYMGGAHQEVKRTSDTWDFSTGRQLHLDDITALTPDTLKGLQTSIKQQIAERLKETPGSYFEDYPYLLRTMFNQNQFFLRPGYIVIYYQQYEIAPYATGIPEFSIPIPANQITTRR